MLCLSASPLRFEACPSALQRAVLPPRSLAGARIRSSVQTARRARTDCYLRLGAGWPRLRRRTPRRRRAARRAPPRRRRRVAAQVRLVRRPQREVPGLRAPPATSRRRPRATSTSRSAARATIPLCDGERRGGGQVGVHDGGDQQGRRRRRSRQQPAERPQPGRRLGVPGPTALVVGQRRRGGQRVQPRQRLQRCRGQDRHQRRAARPRPGRRRRGDLVAGARPDLVQARGRPLEHGRLAWAPRSSDSAVCSGEVRRSPRSRSSTSIPSRAAAYADGTPSRRSAGQRIAHVHGRAQPRDSATTAPDRADPSRYRWRDEPTRTAMSDQPRHWAHSFGGVADAYDRGRPTYPREAAALAGRRPAADRPRARRRHRQADRELVALGHDVHATDPDAAMLERPQAATCPTSAPPAAHAEEIPVARPLGRRRGRRAGVPLVRPRPRAARDRAGAASPAAGLAWSGTSATSGSRGYAGSAR